jgi:TPR repeat protein
MKPAFLAILCGAAWIANCIVYAADSLSDTEMAERYLKAAQSGNEDAQFYLGALYSSGVGRPRSDEEAFRWFSRAADKGQSHAMLILAGLYAIGRGIPKDTVNAYKWAYIVSVNTRVDDFRTGSRQLMGVLETKMSLDEINRAKTDGGKWRAVASQAKPDAPTDEAVCSRDADRLARLRADPSIDAISRFERELGCEQIRPQLRRLRESL